MKNKKQETERFIKTISGLNEMTPKHWALLEQIVVRQPESDANIINKDERRDLSALKLIFRLKSDVVEDHYEKWCVTSYGFRIYSAMKISESSALFNGESVFKNKSY